MPSKLGVHINFITEADTMRDFILDARPVVVKTVHHDAAFWREIKAEYPELLLIGRKFCENQPLDDPEGEAEELASWYRDSSAARFYDAVEGYNELSRSRLSSLCRFDRRMAELVHEEGLKYVAGSWSVGVPEIADWERPEMLDALRVADYVGVHEYCAPRLDDPRGFNPPDTGWFTLRYRQAWDAISKHLENPPRFLITECGIDSGAAHWDPGAQGGWRSFTDAQDYLDQLIWYDQNLQEDDYVAGATIFCLGTLDPTWDTFDLSGEMVSLLANYLREQAEAPPSEREELLARIAELERENAALSRQLTEVQERVAELEQERDTLSRQLADAQARIQEALRALS
ncbi:MAG: hypothetical protein U9Q78_06660 [Chloroflexota bacterium]|nr:hypothetical protein [Chloroflexota bacterium]